MAISESFRKAVFDGDIKGLRIMMKDSLLVDPTFVEFDEMDRLVREVQGLYDLHDGREMENEKSTWDDSYMNKLMVQVVGNFSRERIAHLKDVVRHLRLVAARPRTSISSCDKDYSQRKGRDGYPQPPPSYREQKQQDERDGRVSSSQSPRTSYQEQKRQDERDGRVSLGRVRKSAAGAVVGAVVGGAVGAIMAGTGGAVVVGATAGAVVGGAVVAFATAGE
jgi:hypothetical protein